jgi:hypothetical protein
VLSPAKPHHWQASDFPAGTQGLRLVRMVGPDELRTYDCILFRNGAKGIAWFLNRWFIHGDKIVTSPGDDYGQADVMGDDGWGILDEICIADAATFQRLRIKLGCKVEDMEAAELVAVSGGGER